MGVRLTFEYPLITTGLHQVVLISSNYTGEDETLLTELRSSSHCKLGVALIPRIANIIQNENLYSMGKK